MTQMTSRRVKPSSSFSRSISPAGDVGCCTGATFLPIGSIGQDVIRPVLPGRAVDVLVSPRVLRDRVAFQIRPAPVRYPARPSHQGLEPLRARWIVARVKSIEIERAS